MRAWLTPNTPAAGNLCRRLLIPNSVEFLAIVKGALLPLIYASNFEQFGTLTPQQTADYFQAMYDDFSQAVERTCRMIGEIIPFAGSVSPDAGWLFCDGSSLLRTDYPDLFVVIGTTYGAVDGTHFNIPDMQGRVPVGVGSGTGLSTYNLGDTGGEEAHALSGTENATHDHLYVSNGIPVVATPGVVPVDGSPGGVGTTATSGNGTAHNNIQPFLAVNYLIVAL
jgi:microcystin-dependent protein